jgi:arylsulfatase A-like enzyme
MTPPPTLRGALPLLASGLLAAAYVLLEWLFFATKPSFLGPLSWGEKLAVGAIAPLPVALGCVAATALPWLLGRAIGGVAGSWLGVVAWSLPAFVAATGALILIDNFTYTIFRQGIRTLEGPLGLGYAVLFVVLWGWALRQLLRGARSALAPRVERGLVGVAAVLFAVSLIAVGWRSLAGVDGVRGANAGASEGRLPNILLLASDGLSAHHLSLYGHPRPTTPFLESLAGRALLCENAFANASASAASIVSMLTGKLPTETRLVFAPDTLRGRDAYEHLPGILRGLGYRTLSMTDRIHADPFKLNLRAGFDEANFRTLYPGATESRLAGLDWLYATASASPLALRFSDELYFLGRIGERIADRALHVVGVREMEDPLSQILVAEDQSLSDQARLGRVLEFVQEGSAPVFAQVHLYGTHGPLFHVPERRFSRGRPPGERWGLDAYDDAVLEFDRQVGWLLAQLEERTDSGEWIVVISSDHGMRWRSTRIPLLFLFPGAEAAGVIRSNCQLLDVAPTLLDFLGLPRPPWMTGVSLLQGEPDPQRMLLRTIPGFVDIDPSTRRVSKRNLGPPFHGLGFLEASVCDRSYRLNLLASESERAKLEGYQARHTGLDPESGQRVGRITVDAIEHHTAPCDPTTQPEVAEVQRRMVEHMRRSGFDVSGLR